MAATVVYTNDKPISEIPEVVFINEREKIFGVFRQPGQFKNILVKKLEAMVKTVPSNILAFHWVNRSSFINVDRFRILLSEESTDTLLLGDDGSEILVPLPMKLHNWGPFFDLTASDFYKESIEQRGNSTLIIKVSTSQ